MSKTTLVIPSGSPVTISHAKRTPANEIENVDVCIVSYPKCGRTWLRSILGKYLVLKYKLDEEIMLETELASTASHLKSTKFTHDGAAMLDKLSYLELYYSREIYRNKSVIILGRDLKDTMVSAYFQATKRMEVFQGPISEFIKTDLFGIRKLLAFYDVWMKSKSIPERYLYITYEDLHATPNDTVKKILEFMGETEVDDTILQESLDFNSFDNQKKREKEDTSSTLITKARDVNDPESYKVRKGKVGGYTEYLSQEDEQFIDEWVNQFQFDFDNLKL